MSKGLQLIKITHLPRKHRKKLLPSKELCPEHQAVLSKIPNLSIWFCPHGCQFNNLDKIKNKNLALKQNKRVVVNAE